MNYELLEQINSPCDLKKLSVVELEKLADEIRSFMIETVSRTGGHLGSSLGVVELTLALHYVFDFKADKLLWDVGHQCYAHKIITGRKDGFGLLRHREGPSGFPNPAESQYDQFAVGHAGTAVATAIGMALGQQQKGESDKIVAFVGDGSIVNGVSFEALNNLGLVKRQLLILLNDNSMSIDATQGALAKYFSKIRLSHTYEDLVKTTNNILEHLPVIGKGVEDAINRIKKTIRMTLPASQMFESLNIPYFGPVDGHDIKSLIQLFSGLSALNHPAILHVYTKKGKGFKPAEKENGKYHSIGPFSINGDVVDRPVVNAETFTDVFGEYLVELASKDERIVAITSAMCDGTGLGLFRRRFAGRFYDVGIAESAAVDIAAGLAKTGLKPVVCIYSTFLQRSFDQIFQEVSLQNLPVVFCVDRAGVVGSDGPTHHGLMDIGFLRMMPNMVLAAPADKTEMKLALEFAIGANKPIVLRYPKDAVSDVLSEKSSVAFELGKSVTIRQKADSKVAVVGYGAVFGEILNAAERLAGEGIEVDVVNGRFAAPVDKEIIYLLDSGKDIITVEDHRAACGFGSAVLETASKLPAGKLNGRIVVLGAGREFIKHDSRSGQLMQAKVNADSIVETVKRLVAGK